MDLFKRSVGWGLSLLTLGMAFPASGLAETPGAYRVVKGDCLWKIAARESVYGDPWKWPLLYDQNKGLIADPDRIEVGWRLDVPLRPDSARVAAAVEFARRYGEPGSSRSLPLGPAVENGPPPVGRGVPRGELPRGGWGAVGRPAELPGMGRLVTALLPAFAVIGLLGLGAWLLRRRMIRTAELRARIEADHAEALAMEKDRAQAAAAAEVLTAVLPRPEPQPTPSEEALRADAAAASLPEGDHEHPEEDKKAA